MGGRKRCEVPASLARGRERFESWRRARKIGTRIPERLWTLAVKLANAHGLNRAAAELRLDYYALKKRVEAAKARSRSATSAFVELPPPPPAIAGECVIEFEDAAGACLRVHLKGCDAPDLVALGRGFWQRGG